MARRWIRRSLVLFFVVVVPVITLGACGSAVYTKALWEAGNVRCGQEMERYGGWGIGFNGETDAFVCLVTDAKVRVVARREVPVTEVLGKAGRVPLVPELSAHAMEAVDGDHWDGLITRRGRSSPARH
jgi:hypothetical protein